MLGKNWISVKCLGFIGLSTCKLDNNCYYYYYDDDDDDDDDEGLGLVSGVAVVVFAYGIVLSLQLIYIQHTD